MAYMRALPPRASGGFESPSPADAGDVRDKAGSGKASVTRPAQPAGRRSSPQAKEQQVLDIAAEYFLTHGYDGASINAMARSSGISKESIYRYFNSKKHLFEAVIERELNEYQFRLKQLDATLKMMERRKALLALAETLLSVITSDRMLAMRRLIFEEAHRSPSVGRHFWEIGPGRAYENLEKLFLKHLNVTETDFDPKVLSQYFVALLTHKVMLERACGVRKALTEEQIRTICEGVVDDFLKAFLRTV